MRFDHPLHPFPDASRGGSPVVAHVPMPGDPVEPPGHSPEPHPLPDEPPGHPVEPDVPAPEDVPRDARSR